MKKSVDPDQLASLEEAHCFEPTMFLKMGYRAFKNQYMYYFFFLLSIQSPNVVKVFFIP